MTVIRHSLALSLLILTGLFDIPPAQAEPVAIETPDHGKRQGWMFGSAVDGRCWLAMPNHLLKRAPEAVIFTDQSGNRGEAGPVLFIEGNADAMMATGGNPDLAFAPLRDSQKKCLSSLGLPEFSYNAILKERPDLQVIDLLATSARLFDVSVKQVKIDEAGGRSIGIWPTETKAVESMTRGISGATATVVHSSGRHPFAMILAANEKREIGYALRFDAIRGAFSAIHRDWRLQQHSEKTRRSGTGYEISSFSAILLGDKKGPSVLQKDEGCWVVAAEGGASIVELIIRTTSEFDRVENIVVDATDACHPAAKNFYLEHRSEPSDNWVYLGQCSVLQHDDTSLGNCRVGVSAEQEFRLRFPTNGGKMSIGRLILNGGSASQ